MVERMVRKRVVVLMSVVVMSIVLFLIGRANGQVGMYKGYYGNSIVLFLLGGNVGKCHCFYDFGNVVESQKKICLGGSGR